MSKQTDMTRVIIDNARGGNKAAENFLRELLSTCAKGRMPLHVLLEMSELLLYHGIEAGKEQLRQN